VSGSGHVNLTTELSQPEFIEKDKQSFLRENRGKVLAVTLICRTRVVAYVSSRISNTQTLNETQFY
jgi:hypothetical protein